MSDSDFWIDDHDVEGTAHQVYLVWFSPSNEIMGCFPTHTAAQAYIDKEEEDV